MTAYLTIKAQIMAALETGLAVIPEVKAVERIRAAATDLDNMQKPVICIYDDQEDMTIKPGRIECKLRVILGVFITLSPAGRSSFNAVADLLQGKIQDALVNNATLKGLLNFVGPQGLNKTFPSDILGMLTLIYQLNYAHNVGDATSQTFI